ncbi:LPXTG cell wall anchor domain-containing protein, partial [Staphylococcus carnosus]
GQEVEGDLNATPEQVKQAADVLNEALDAKKAQDAKDADEKAKQDAKDVDEKTKQAALDELNKAIEAAKAVNKADYTPNTVTPLDNAVKAGVTAKADTNKTPEELKQAAKAINDAKDALKAKAEQDTKDAAEKVNQENKVDKTELSKSIAKAESINFFDPGDKEDAAVLDALSNAKEVEADTNALQSDVDKTKDVLEKALSAKAEQDAKDAAEKVEQDNKVDKTELNKSIAKAESINFFDPGDKEDAAVLDALSNAIEAAANPNISQTKVNETVAALNSAIATKNAQDTKDAAEAAKVKQEVLDTDETQEEIIDEEIIQPNNEDPIVDEKVDSTVVDEPTIKPVEERQKPSEVSKDKLAELQKVITIAEKTHTTEYTQQSVEALEKAVKNGKSIVENSDGFTIEEIQNALQTIEDAIHNLEVKESTTIPPAEKVAESKLTSNVENVDSNSTVKSTVKQNHTVTKEVNHKAENSKEKVLPKTGENLAPVHPIYATLMFAIGGLMMFFRKRKNEDKDSTEK